MRRSIEELRAGALSTDNGHGLGGHCRYSASLPWSCALVLCLEPCISALHLCSSCLWLCVWGPAFRPFMSLASVFRPLHLGPCISAPHISALCILASLPCLLIALLVWQPGVLCVFYVLSHLFFCARPALC